MDYFFCFIIYLQLFLLLHLSDKSSKTNTTQSFTSILHSFLCLDNDSHFFYLTCRGFTLIIALLCGFYYACLNIVVIYAKWILQTLMNKHFEWYYCDFLKLWFLSVFTINLIYSVEFTHHTIRFLIQDNNRVLCILLVPAHSSNRYFIVSCS